MARIRGSEIAGNVAMARAAFDEFRAAWKRIPEFAKDECPLEVVEKIIKSIPSDSIDYFILISGCYGNCSGYPDVLLQIATSHIRSISREKIEDIFVALFIMGCDLESNGYGWRLTDGKPLSVFLNREQSRDVLLRVITDSDYDSSYYIEAARLLYRRTESAKDIECFRRMWSQLSSEKREAIAIDLKHQELMEIVKHSENRYGLTLIPGFPSKLEAWVRGTDSPVTPLYRRRWIDDFFPALRGLFWKTFTETGRSFVSEVRFLGREEEQVGTLLAYLMTGMRQQVNLLSQAVGSQGPARGRLNVDRYIFDKTMEKRWGPDFALVFWFKSAGSLSVARYSLFQAKLVKHGSLEVPVDQLRTLLRSSWHSSIYVAWDGGTPPHCIPASSLEAFNRVRRQKGRIVSSPRFKWDEVSRFSCPLADLLVDQFLCGELGDPLPEEKDWTPSDVAVHIGREFGPLPHGVIVFTLELFPDGEGEGGASVSAEDRVIHGDEQ